MWASQHSLMVYLKRNDCLLKINLVPHETVFILISGFIQNVYSEEVKKIEELTVSASPIGLQSLEHCAAPFTVLDGEELRGRQDSTIGETLSNIPGITTDRFSPLASRPVIRGLGGKRVQI